MSCRLFPFGSSRVLDRPWRLRTHAGAFVVACAAFLIPFVASAAGFTVTPTTLAFGNVPTGATGTIAVTIKNTSGISQTPNFAGGAPNDPTNFGGSQNCAGVALAAGATCQFTYTFMPATIGAHTSATTIAINSDNFSITMSGTGISPVTVAPRNLLFGNVVLNTTATIPVVITNTSGVPQTPNYAGGAPNDPTNFGGSQNCAGVTLPAGGSCQFNYTFTPKTVGAHSTTTTIDVNSESFAITMSGTGITASGLSVAPTTINFGSVLVGTTSAAMSVTVTNGSSAPIGPLNVVGGAPAAPFAATQTCAGVTLAPGGTCKFSYTFTPTAPAPASASSSFTINGEAFSISLSGNGTSVSNLNQHGLTGSWYEAATGGQGIEVEVYANPSGPGSAFVSWFTFDTVIGGAERQRWYTAQGPVVTGQSNIALTIFQNTGGNFNAPPATSAQAVGNATLSFNSCTSGQLTYTFTDGSNRTGTIPLTRLTQNVTCAPSAPFPTNADFALSGNWFGGAATSGQGMTVEVNPTSGAFFGAWYTYMPNSPSPGPAGQRWYTAQGAFAGMRVIPVTIFETTGGMFDAPTPPGQKTLPVGTGTMTFQSCSAAKFDYSFTGGTSIGLVGSINLVRVGPVPPGCTS